MPCYSPLKGYKSRTVNQDTGKRSLTFRKDAGYTDLQVTVPCGVCIGCRIKQRAHWALRCMHEAQMHEHNCFITLTYDEEHLPKNGSISKEELQKFFKRLRKAIYPKKLRYYACGEYGDKSGRPHYHALIFGYDFPDKVIHSKPNNDVLYTSNQLEKAWGKGYAPIGNVTYQSAHYVTGYINKKWKGTPEEIEKHYEQLNTQTGEIRQITPEFATMSRRPGIGATWLAKYKSDTDKDFITHRGKKLCFPKYYDTLLEGMGEDMAERKAKRKKRAKPESPERNRAIEKTKALQLKKMQRPL